MALHIRELLESSENVDATTWHVVVREKDAALLNAQGVDTHAHIVICGRVITVHVDRTSSTGVYVLVSGAVKHVAAWYRYRMECSVVTR